MIRTPRLVLAAAATAVLSAGCSTFTNTARVAEVNGTSISTDDYEQVAPDFFAYPDLFGTVTPEQGRADADSSRRLVGALVVDELLRALVGDDAVEAASDEYLATLPEDDPARAMSSEMQALLGATQVRDALLAEIPAPTAEDLEQRYSDDPAALGVMCVRQILVDSEDAADDVVEQLAEGADFVELAREVSVDATVADNDGALVGVNGPCMTLDEAAATQGPLTAGAIDGSPGGAPAIVETDAGWQVVVHRAWSEVAEAVLAVHAEGVTGQAQFLGALFTADVDVDPTYGIWDSIALGVVPLG